MFFMESRSELKDDFYHYKHFSLRQPVLVLLACLALSFAVHISSAFAESEDSYGTSIGSFHLSGEAGGALFQTGDDGQFPNSEFRVDEAKIFVEAPVFESIFFFGEINAITREEADEQLHLGELYVEFDTILSFWNQDRLLNAKAGRFDIPFGEEYQTRDAIDSPLISHSLSDIWGVDEGVEAFGSIGRFDYVLAVQNGGDPIAHDFNPDKAVAGRLTFKAAPSTHISISAMRTGALDVAQDKFSEMWFGNGFLRVLGSHATTVTFRANVFQADGHAGWTSGHLHAAGGHFEYLDDDTAANNNRTVNYFYVETIQNIFNAGGRVLYAGTRYSRMTSDLGFPIVANGNFDRFLFDNAFLTNRIWRLAFGIGYRLKRNLLLKTEYNVERGTTIQGLSRNNENFFGAEAAVRF